MNKAFRASGLRSSTSSEPAGYFGIMSQQVKQIAVTCGGFSGEAEISRKSAAMVVKHMDHSRFMPTLVHIEPDGWFAEPEPGQRHPMDAGAFTWTDGEGVVHGFDAVFEMVHGTPGEDGRLSAYFELLGMPYTASSPRTLAIGHHKAWTTALLSSMGLPVAPSRIFHRDVLVRLEEIAPELAADFGFPCFVKACESGSSIGVTRVEHASEFQAAFEAGFEASEAVMVEGFLDGREFTCGVIPSSPGGAPRFLPVTEIITDNAFFDYAAKYEGKSREVTPADLDAAMTRRIQALSVQVYQDLDCRGMARVDFINHNGTPHIVEVNTVPGFSEMSVIPQQAREVGLSPTELISLLIDDALARG
jgi:D-alanine-D-alanine ligase